MVRTFGAAPDLGAQLDRARHGIAGKSTVYAPGQHVFALPFAIGAERWRQWQEASERLISRARRAGGR